MRYVIVPGDVTLVDYSTGKAVLQRDGSPEKPFSMGRYLLSIVCTDPQLGKEQKDKKAVRAVRLKFASAKPGDILELEDDHWDRICKAIREPSGVAMVPTHLEQFLDFDEAFLEAKSQPPAKE